MICYCCDKPIEESWTFCPFSGFALIPPNDAAMSRDWSDRLKGNRSLAEIATLRRNGLTYREIAKQFGMRPLAGEGDLKYVIWMEWRSHGNWTPDGPYVDPGHAAWRQLSDDEQVTHRATLARYREAWLLRYARPDSSGHEEKKLLG